VAFAKRFLALLLLGSLALPLLLPYLLLRPWMGRPPHVPTTARFLWFLGRILGERPPSGPLGPRLRLALLLMWAQQLCLVPLFSMAWYLDRLLYGRLLDAQTIVAPFFELSAARSGSTQLAHHLEEDPHFVAPNIMQFLFPYLWLWKLAPRTVGRLFTKEQIQNFALRQVPEVYLERHELDPYCTDTFEVPFLALHLGALSMGLGAEVMKLTLSATVQSPWNRAIWEQDLPDYIESLGKKLLLWRGEPCRLMIKGHFLGSAEALERRFPDALFLTMIRDPAKRIQSTLNFHRCQPGDSLVGPPRWAELVAYDLPEEIAYCKLEQSWFMSGDTKKKMVVRFEDYRRDLPGSLRRVYQELLQQPERAQPVAHTARKRSGYSVDRSLEQVGVDPAELEKVLATYRQWCAGGDGVSSL
ncbi:MAG TPA: sulfotransferase, partial [Myxococcota bacterium]|nr:sulfotransferase [Myxococcota bacterium]